MSRRRALAAVLVVFLLVSVAGVAFTVMLTSAQPGPLALTLVLGAAALLATIAYRVFLLPVTLQRKVEARTQELQASLLEAWLQKRELEAVKDHVSGVLRTSPDAVIGVNGDGTITEWNEAAGRIFGWDRTEILGHDLGELVPVDGPALYVRHAERLLAGERVREVVPAARRDGSVFHAEVTLAGFPAANGRLRTIVGIVRDVTEQRLVDEAATAMGESLNPQQALTALAAVLIEPMGARDLSLWMVERPIARRLAWVSSGDEPIGGATSLPLEGGPFADAVRSRAVVVCEDPRAYHTTHSPQSDSLVFFPLLQGGEVIGILAATFPSTDPPQAHTISLLERVAQRITQAAGHIILYQRQRQITGKLQELDELRSDFLSTVSHELRTPLTTITGFAATLDDHWDHLERGQREHFIRQILTRAGKLERLIEGLLDFSRLEQGQLSLDPRPCDIRAEVVREAEALGSSQLRDRDVRVEAPAGVLVFADPGALKRILENLLMNAAKFSPSTSVIGIRVLHTAEEVIVQVQDEGPGLPREEHERIFERFYRVRRGDDSGLGGTGIGLAIVRQFVRAQGGEAWVESEPGQGSTFCFTLPRVRTQEIMEADEKNPETRARA